jgi:hypothetical protein
MPHQFEMDLVSTGAGRFLVPRRSEPFLRPDEGRIVEVNARLQFQFCGLAK